MTYMIIDSRGNAIDSFETFRLAVGVLKMIVEHEPEAKDELVIVEYDSKGHAINACKYEDL